MKKRRNHIYIILFIGLLVFLLFAQSTILALFKEESRKQVLIIHSYHKGLKWTDDIMAGINAVLNVHLANTDIHVEYMDTKRVYDSDYMHKLYEIYKYKFHNKKIDIVLSCDDDAFNFLRKYQAELFPDTPVVFCGVNYYEDSMLELQSMFTGVVEVFGIRETVEQMLKLHPNTQSIYYVNDKTTTGIAIQKKLNEIIPQFQDRVKFIAMDGSSIEELKQKAGSLPPDSLVLLLVFYQDTAGTYYTAEEGAKTISSASNSPVYGLWDFHLGHGIVGGMITSGFRQGELMATMALRVLQGEKPASIPVSKEDANRFMFDFVQMKRFGIKNSDLPAKSLVINQSYIDKQQVLVLNSYHHGMAWTDGIEEGIKSVFAGDKNISLYFDYMDTKRNVGADYVQQLTELYKYKYGNKKFDAVITSDDDAFNFLRKYQDRFFSETPVVFCGVNYFNDSVLQDKPLFTGVVEAIDIKNTLEIALKIHPKTKQVVIINDKTTTGMANKKLLQDVMPGFIDKVRFKFLEEMTMIEVQDEVKKLSGDSIILLMSFNEDRANNIFSYEESAELIAQNANVPIYAIWDFFLGHGVVGGKMVNAFTQGETAAQATMRILKGEKPANIPVVKADATPNRYMFDYNQLKKYGINKSNLPPESIIVNEPVSFYSQNKTLFWGIGLFILFLMITIVVLYGNIMRRKQAEAELAVYATTDTMTGILNRRGGLLLLEKQVEMALCNNSNLSICFIDINDLKAVNDKYGHAEGDIFIQLVCRFMAEPLCKSDILCRLGGDEFLLIFPDTDLASAEVIWQRIAEGLERYNQERVKDYIISVSHGCAEYNPSKPVSLDELIRVADSAMYKEKQEYKRQKNKL